MPSESKPAVVNAIDVLVKLAIPVILGFAGHWVSLAIEKSQSATKMVELAIEIKRVEQIDPRIDEWAESVLGRYSGVEFPTTYASDSMRANGEDEGDEPVEADPADEGDEDQPSAVTEHPVPTFKSASPRIRLREDQQRIEGMRDQLVQLIETNAEGATKFREWLAKNTRYGQNPVRWIGQASEDELTRAFRVAGIPTNAFHVNQLPSGLGPRPDGQ